MQISVIIPAYNAQKTIRQCLKGVLNQHYPKKDFEVMVIDDGSVDQTPKIVSEFKGVVLARQKNAGPAVARNRGAKKCRGDIVVFLDSDCVPKPDWLKEMIKPFEKDWVAGVQGKYENPLGHWMARFVQFEIEERYERLKKSMKQKDSIDFIGSYSAAYRKKIFLENNGFDEGFRMASGEDPDLSFRLAKKGFKFVFAPAAVVLHFHPTSLLRYWKTKFFRSYWRVRLYQKNPEKMKNDSYTNPLIKYQMILIGFFISFLVLYLAMKIFFGSIDSAKFRIAWVTFSLFAIAISFVLSFPTAFFILKKDAKIGLVSPFILTVNALVFVAGFVYGAVRLGKSA